MLQWFNEQLWGFPLLTLLLITGVYLTLKTHFFQFTHFFCMLRETLGSLFRRDQPKTGVSPFAAMSAALSGTMGTGNIAGVGTAIALGGAGALFWMWISAFLCMLIKFAEVALAVQYREQDKNGEYRGGPMYVIRHALPRLRPFAILFCICTICASFGIGNAAQAQAMAQGLQTAVHIPPLLTGLVAAGLCAAVIFGSARRITACTAKLVPFMTLFYFAGAAILLFINRQQLWPAICEIFSQAFSFPAVSGGAAGFTISRCIRYGVSRGVFTNEAGMGSAPIVHASAENAPKKQGYWGMLEVFLDTIVMCTLTGLTILSSGVHNGCNTDPLNYTLAAFSAGFGPAGAVFIAVSIALFAFGAMIGWSFYGASCCRFLFRRKAAVLLYRLLFCGCILLGAAGPAAAIFELSDILNGLMAIPNLLTLLLLGKQVRAICRDHTPPSPHFSGSK